MIVVRNVAELGDILRGSCLTIGNFDGVHLGHQRLLSRVTAKAKAQGLESIAVTFDPHPMRVLAGPHTPPFITLTGQKLELIGALGLECTVVLEFTREMAALEPEQFVKTYLVEGLKVKEMVIGYDYAFGRDRKGNFDLLLKLGEKYGFRVERLGPVIIDGAVVSSTRIRDLIQVGKVWEARSLLGRFYTVRGKVVRGRDRGGRLLGFPTANLQLVDEFFPKTGVYAIWAVFADKTWPAVANIGYNPTFGNKVLSVEAHILDFDQEIYDKDLRVSFVQRLRSEKKFSGIEELSAQIKKDIALGRQILADSEAQP
ncbi:MAG: bifunctional riboflavin kinase/FAD synthetase [Thermodesulfobacteriota bacterium]|nr:bifunctional riboflavin kinase/FAD synthetase [Thermodesulfobacteriota bacterium]